jgi:hypothetical protein
MPRRSLVRGAFDYPPVYYGLARGIAIKAVPTLNDDYDDPPLAGPFPDKTAIRIFRATWHNFREALRLHPDVSSPPRQLYNILSNISTRTVSHLKFDGTEEFWIKFCPHPFILTAWRMDQDRFEGEKRGHARYVDSIPR